MVHKRNKKNLPPPKSAEEYERVISFLTEEVADLRAIFDLWGKRLVEIREQWSGTHPEQDLTWPDLGAMLKWMLEENERLRKELEEASDE